MSLLDEEVARAGDAGPDLCRPPELRQVWANDFVFDACANGQQLKCLTVVDEYTRECLAIDVAGCICSGRVIEVLCESRHIDRSFTLLLYMCRRVRSCLSTERCTLSRAAISRDEAESAA